MGRPARRGWKRALCLCMALAAICVAGSRAEKTGDYAYAALEDGSVEITGWSGSGVNVDVPAELDGMAVTAIGPGAFAGSDKLETVALPEGVRSLGDGAFADCYSLEEISIPATVSEVGENPFAGCENLRKIDLAASQTTLEMVNGVLFSEGGARLIFCPRVLPMERYVVPEGTRRIDARAFSYCNRLLSVTLPDSVTEIGAEAFEGRANLTLVVGRGSYAEAYAQQNDIRYTYPDAAEWLAE